MATATITAFKFDTPDGAEQMLDLVKDLSKQQLITLQDAAIVTWPQGKKKPKIRQLQSLAGAGALGGAFWGMLFGLIFGVPFFGMALGAGFSSLSGESPDYGTSKAFIDDVEVVASNLRRTTLHDVVDDLVPGDLIIVDMVRLPGLVMD